MAELSSARAPLEVISDQSWLSRAIDVLLNTPDHSAIWLLPQLQAMADAMKEHPQEDGSASEMPDLAAFLAAHAPPDLPQDCAALPAQELHEGLAPPIRWISETTARAAPHERT